MDEPASSSLAYLRFAHANPRRVRPSGADTSVACMAGAVPKPVAERAAATSRGHGRVSTATCRAFGRIDDQIETPNPRFMDGNGATHPVAVVRSAGAQAATRALRG